MKIRAILAATAALALVPAVAAIAQTVGDSATAGQVERRASADSGAQVYRQICQGCHMANGEGGRGAGVFPALANNPRLAASAYPITMVVRGRGGMPSFADLLTPDQTAAVVGYVRTHFGNAYPEPVTAAEVRRLAGGPGSEE